MSREKEKVNKNPIGRYVARNWWRYLIALAALVVSVALDVWFPLVTKSIVDDVLVGGNMEILKRDLVFILIIGGGRAVSQYVKEFTCDICGSRVASLSRKNLFNHIQTLSRSYFNKNNTGELMARVKDDVDRIWDVFGFVGMLIIEAVLYLVGVVVCMLRLNWQLSFIPIAAMPVMGFMAIRLERRLDKVYDDISEQNAVLNTVVQENLSGVRTVKSFAREDYELEKFRRNNEKYSELNVKQATIMAKFDPNMGFVPKVMQLALLLIGGYAVIKGNVSLGVLTAFIQYANNIVWPMENMGWLTNALAAAFASNKKINKILAEKPEIYNAPDALSPDETEGNLCFEGVSFSLDGSSILDNISFELPKGKTLGIMGVTGAGKSTIVNLINRFYDVSDGKITIDGRDIRELSLETVRGCTSVVTQDVFLFSDTISQNIKLGSRGTMSDERVKSAVAAAHAAEFVDKLGEGYDTVIGERGVGLSGGQKQRLSIARALAKNAQILILDDSTSALDMETEYEIQQNLSRMKDTSKIIIAHRISSVRHADEIIILDRGHIAERGTHEELMEAKGLYYSTYEAQYGDYRKALEIIGEEELICQ
ncbi:MAG: ABC transporter ATP-binding protein/permease [Butyrivibrio sp.]|nr:ABC transporter ATP-binding protein/permease [Butyrivibrio sp.]